MADHRAPREMGKPRRAVGLTWLAKRSRITRNSTRLHYAQLALLGIVVKLASAGQGR